MYSASFSPSAALIKATAEGMSARKDLKWVIRIGGGMQPGGGGRIAGQRTTQREVDVHGRFADPFCVSHHLHTPAPQVVEDLRPGGVAGEADPFHLNELAFLLRLPDFYT